MSAIWALAVYFERVLVMETVVPLPGTQLNFWVSDFMRAAATGVWMSGGGSLIWYLLTRWAFPVLDWGSAGRRLLWGGVGGVTVAISTVYGFYYVPYAESGGVVAYTLFFGNSLVIYYLSTAFASPPSYKYTPVGARSLRFF